MSNKNLIIQATRHFSMPNKFIFFILFLITPLFRLIFVSCLPWLLCNEKMRQSIDQIFCWVAKAIPRRLVCPERSWKPWSRLEALFRYFVANCKNTQRCLGIHFVKTNPLTCFCPLLTNNSDLGFLKAKETSVLSVNDTQCSHSKSVDV